MEVLTKNNTGAGMENVNIKTLNQLKENSTYKLHISEKHMKVAGNYIYNPSELIIRMIYTIIKQQPGRVEPENALAIFIRNLKLKDRFNDFYNVLNNDEKVEVMAIILGSK